MKLTFKSQHLIQILYYYRLKYFQYFGKPVLIWNMGKVASTSIARSLWRHIGRHNVLTTHFLNRDGHFRSKLLYDHLFINSTKPLTIISLTREPIGKNISSFFQNFEQNVGTPFEQYNSNIEQLCDTFLNHNGKHDPTINWFDDNLLQHIGLNVYDYPFDPSKGYCIIEHDRYRILILRSEENDSTKEKAIKELLCLSDFHIKNENVGSLKPYSKLYKKFQKALDLPESYLNKMLTSRYTQHFYSASEIEKIRTKWHK